MWTVIGALNNDEQVRPEAEGSHAFLILSQEDSTMVLCIPCTCNIFVFKRNIHQLTL